jgi:methionyl-tRNA formyltransferase
VVEVLVENATLAQPRRIKLAFFGTPAYAVPTLRALASDARFDVRMVVTQPDRQAGRGHQLVEPAVKVAAQELGLPIMQPPTLRDEDARAQLRSIEADLFVVAAYGLIFSRPILDMPDYGCLNLHASLLPHYRGAAPIPAAILNGDAETGVTLMMMERGLDTGPIVAVAKTPIEPTDTTESLTARLAGIGAQLAVDKIPELISGQIESYPQPAGATAVRPLTKADGQIDWRQPAERIERQVRAMWPWPRAWTLLGDRQLQLHSASVAPGNESGQPGRIEITGGRLAVRCGDGNCLVIDRAQLAGSKPASGASLANGRVIASGDTLPSADPPEVPFVRPVNGDATS